MHYINILLNVSHNHSFNESTNGPMLVDVQFTSKIITKITKQNKYKIQMICVWASSDIHKEALDVS